MLQRGYNYLVLDAEVEDSYSALAELSGAGVPSLCLTTIHPKKAKEKHSLDKADVVWITEAKAEKGGEAISPKRPQFELSERIFDFIESNGDCVVLVDGFGYLVLENGLEAVRKFVKKVQDKASQRGSTFILPMDPESAPKEALASMQRDFDRVGLKEFQQKGTTMLKVKDKAKQVAASVGTQKRTYPIDLDVAKCAAALHQHFVGRKFETQLVGEPPELIFQLRKRGALRVMTGTQSALTVQFRKEGDGLEISMGEQKWTEKVAVGAVGAIIFAPLFLTAAYGMYKQAKLPEEIWGIIDRHAKTPGTESSQRYCRECGAVLGGGKKCPGCGRAL